MAKDIKIPTRKGREEGLSAERWIGNTELSDRVTCLSTREMAIRFKIKTYSRRENMSELIRGWIQEYLDDDS